MENPREMVLDAYGMVTQEAVRVNAFVAIFGGDQIGYATLSPEKARKLAKQLNEAADKTEEMGFGAGRLCR